MKSTTLINLLFLLVTSVTASHVNIVNKNAAPVVDCDGDSYYAAGGIFYPTPSLAKRDGEGVGTNGDTIGSVSGNVLQRPDGLLDFVTAWMPVGEHGGNGKESVWAGKKRRSLTGMGKGERGGESEEGESEEGEGEEGEGVQDEEQNGGDDNEDHGNDDNEDHGNDDDGDKSSNDDDGEVNDEGEDHGELDDAEEDADDGSDDDDVYSILPIPTGTTRTLFAKRGGPGPNFETERPILTTQTATDGRMPKLTMCWV